MNPTKKPPAHELLTREEFKQAVIDLGRTAYLGGALFNSLGQTRKWDYTFRRTAEDVMYVEYGAGASEPEAYVSLPNLSLHLRDFIDRGQLSGKQAEAAMLLVEKFAPQDTPAHNGDTPEISIFPA